MLIAGLILDGDLAADARVGGLGLGAVTAPGVRASVCLDALRAERQFVRAAATEIVAVALYLATMLALIFGGAGLGALIAASGALPLYSGTLSALVARRAGLGLRVQPSAATRPRVMSIVPTAGWLLVIELVNDAPQQTWRAGVRLRGQGLEVPLARLGVRPGDGGVSVRSERERAKTYPVLGQE